MRVFMNPYIGAPKNPLYFSLFPPSVPDHASDCRDRDGNDSNPPNSPPVDTGCRQGQISHITPLYVAGN